MTDEQRTKCYAIIHTATAACSAIGGGLAQLPGSDAIPIALAQMAMVESLGVVFGKSLDKSAVTALIAGFGGSGAGRLISQFALGWIPGLGNALNAGTAFAITEAIGWKIAEKFDRESQSS